MGTIKDIDKLPFNEQIKILIEQGDINQSQALIMIAENNAEVFLTDNEQVFASIKVLNVVENVAVSSAKFKKMLRMKFYEIFKKPVTKTVISDAIETIIANAEFNYTSYNKIYLRVGKNNQGNKIFIDLADENRNIIEIDKFGWRIIKDPPVKFKRPKTMEALPVPISGGSIQEIDKFFNVKEEDKILLYSFLIGCLIPSHPYPILILQGQQGSGKSFLSRIIKSLVDPTYAPIRALPKSEEDLFVSAHNTRLLVFDNISKLSNRMSDAFCKLSTGGGYTARKLYENDEEVVLSTTRPLILNGIDYIAKRPDLADRSIILNLTPISQSKRTPEADMEIELNKLKPSVLGALCSAISEALNTYDKTEMNDIPRMADFAKWVTSAETSFGYKKGTFLKTFKNNQQEVMFEAIEHDLLISTIIECLKVKQKISGSATVILDSLSNYVTNPDRKSVDWIKSNQLKDELNRIAPILEALNITYHFKRTGQERTHTLEMHL